MNRKAENVTLTNLHLSHQLQNIEPSLEIANNNIRFQGSIGNIIKYKNTLQGQQIRA